MKLTALFIPLLSCLLVACDARKDSHATSGAAKDDKVIKHIMSDAAFNSELAPILKAEVAKQGYTLNWVVVNDIIQPNKLVDDGSADSNSFQHEPYFDQFVTDHGLKNVVRGFYTVFTSSGLYSKKYKSLEQVPDGATFGIPVDPANNGRALFMLRDKGLLKMKDGVTVTHARLKDITENPHHFRFKEVDQLMLQRALDDVDVGFLFSAIAMKAGFDFQKDSLAMEGRGVDSPFKGMVAIRKDLVGSPKIEVLKRAYESEAIKAFYQKHYGDAIQFLDEMNK